MRAHSDNGDAIFSGKDGHHLQLLANYKEDIIRIEEKYNIMLLKCYNNININNIILY